MNTTPRRVIALGFFDGVHNGHGALLQRVLQRSAQLGAAPAAFTFDIHPESLIFSRTTPTLTDLPQRQERVGRLYGIDDVIVAHSDQQMMRTPWRNFVTDYLVGQCGAIHLVVGHDFRFGHRNAGTPALLMKKAAQLGMGCDIIPAVTLDGITVSSTHIRALLQSGEMAEAARFLGYPYTMRGKVRHGKGLGRTIGAPTLNLIPSDHQLIPAYGVYATRVTVDGREYGAVTNVGVRPTVDENGGVTVESHLLDVSAQLYGSDCRVEFLRRLRGEMKFESLAALQAQIGKDIALAKEILEK